MSNSPRSAATHRRLLMAGVLAVGAALSLTGTAFAVSPERDGGDVAIDPPDVGVSSDVNVARGDTASANYRQGGAAKTPRGYDVSYPQCGGQLPSNPAFSIVGVNRGIVFSANPCLSSQVAWGGGTVAQLYVNTGNPGPALSSHWPSGQTSPRVCNAGNPDTVDCAYDYGWNAAASSFETAQSAYTSLGITSSPAATGWWLDVETSNSWRSGSSTALALNVAALQGEFDSLRAAGVTQIGFYSTTSQWTTITGGTKVFSPAPSWGAGSPSERAAKNLCANTVTSFTGGRLALVQYPYQGFDADLAC